MQADSGRVLDVRNPANGELVGQVPAMGATETRRAIDAASRCAKAWRGRTAKARQLPLRGCSIDDGNQEDLAIIMTAEQGKPLAEARGEIAYAASFIEFFAEEAKRVYGDTIPQHLPGGALL